MSVAARVCACVCAHSGELAADRDIGPFLSLVGVDNCLLHIHICKHAINNFPLHLPLPLSKG